ncbi:MAG: hypothetical protein ACKV19_11420 [Verrucomicrobiales bacterium]
MNRSAAKTAPQTKRDETERRDTIFPLTAADGAIGSHSAAVLEARKQFHSLANDILLKIEQE